MGGIYINAANLQELLMQNNVVFVVTIGIKRKEGQIMEIQIISDLHHEFGTSLLDFNDIDLLIVAGDSDIGTKGISWLKEHINHIPVIYVLGNHEYYKGSYPKNTIQNTIYIMLGTLCGEYGGIVLASSYYVENRKPN